MEDFTYKRIYSEDYNQVKNLINIVFENIERKDFLIPWTQEQMEHFFDNNYSILFGAYDENKLVAMCQIFTQREIEDEYYDILNIPRSKNIGELGGFLVLPEYRNKGIMTNLSKLSCEYLPNMNLDYLISTIHPENNPSNKIIQKLDFQLYDTILTQSGYLRNLYLKELSNNIKLYDNK